MHSLTFSICVIFLSGFLISLVRSKVVINELNIVDPKKPEKKQFIELKSMRKEYPLRGYKLIGMNCKDKSGTIDLIVTLWNEKTDKNGFYTIGGSEVEVANMKVGSDFIKFRNGFNDKQSNSKLMSNFISNGKSELRAIGLLYDREKLNSFQDFILSSKRTSIKIDDNIIEQLKKYLIDLVVYGETVACDKCKLFETIHSDFLSKQYTLREFPTNSKGEDISINRCAIEFISFLPEKFKIGKPTPAKENDCSGAHFSLEEHILEIIPHVQTISSYADDYDNIDGASCSNQPECTSTIQQNDYSQVSTNLVNEAIQRASDSSISNSCSDLMLYPGGANTALTVDQENNRKRHIGVGQDHSEDLEWQSTKYFRDEWIDQIAKHQGGIIPIDEVKKRKVWFEYLFNKNKPTESRYRCRLCFKHFDTLGLEARYKNALAFEEGTLKDLKRENGRIIREHAEIPGHKTIIQILEQQSAKRLRADFEEIQRIEDMANEGKLKITAVMFRTIFLEIKKNIPFDSHSSIVKLQEIHGVDMGYHHYEKCGAISMMESMSGHMHQLLINHMVTENLPFSIIIDGSTDSTQNHFLIVYFQILEKNIPVMVFYRLIETSYDVTANGYYKTICEAFKLEDKDFFNYYKRNLVGYVSDGEAVMSGRQGGLISYIRKDSVNPIFAIHCMAHRLELAIERALKKVPYFKDFEQLINKIFQFYNWNASKRKAHLKETTSTLKVKMYALNYVYGERWIASQSNAITNFKKMWYPIIKDMEIISKDPIFDKKIQSSAVDLSTKMKGKFFLAITNFLSDVLHHLKFWSLKMQEKTALLVDFADFKDKICDTFENLKTVNGRDLNILLLNSSCDGEPCGSIENYYEAKNMKYILDLNKEIELISENGVPSVIAVRNSVLTALNTEIKSYFPSSDLKLFKIFRPMEFPSDNIGLALTYGVIEINNLCGIFKMEPCLQLVSDWTKLVISIMDHEKFCEYRDDKTETYVFWTRFLNEEGIDWTDRTKQLIRTVLVLPVGSAEAERGFSIMNHLKTSRRSRLLPKHMEDIMRIRINSVNEIEKFAASKYANEFIKQKHYRTDDPKGRRNKAVSLTEVEDKAKKFLPKPSFL